MHVERYGQGGKNVYLAIHGWGGDHREFAPLAARRPSDATVYSVDLPGYGRSPPPVEWTLQGVADEVRAAARELGGAITLIGFCSGATVAMTLARDEPARFRRLVMIDPFAFLPWYFRIFTMGEFGRRAYRATFAAPAGRGITNWVLRRRQSSDADFTAAFARVNHEVVQRYLALFARADGFEPYRGLTLPVDLAVGERTFAAVRESVRRFQSVWPQAHVHTLRHVGHLPMVRGAPQLAKLVFSR